MEKKQLIFEDWPCTVTLPLKIATQPFRMALWVMMMRHLHHTKFGCIQFIGSEDIFRTKV